MESRENRDFDLYKDIQGRTNGEIYIGVVGPVRTGKSTFIKRFMDLFVLPNMEDENARRRAEDELPQSAAGKTHYAGGSKRDQGSADRLRRIYGAGCKRTYGGR